MSDESTRADAGRTRPSTAHDGSTITVRGAHDSDLDALISLLEEIMAHHGVPRPARGSLTRTLRSILTSDSHLFLVAESGGSIIGMCALVFTVSTWSAGPVCEIQDVIVTDESRGAGAGRLLLEAAEDVARERGCVRLFLHAEPANLGAHAFYRSLGLEEKTSLHFERSLDDPR